MAYVPQDLVFDVLSRLPVKSLLRFKCVSKLWFGLIHSPEFIDFHLYRSKSSTKIIQQTLFLPNYCPGVFFELEFAPYNNCKAVDMNLYSPRSNSFSVVGTCNGLICLVMDSGFLEPIVLWNPSTRKHLQLPVLIHNPILCGFGYDQITKDYKVLMVIGTYRKETCYKFYNLKSNSWGPKRKQSGIYLSGKNSTFYNGAIYFVGEVDNRDYDGNFWVVAFDLATEECRKVVALPVPDILWSWIWPWSDGGLSTLGDSLCAISASMEVWVMKSEEGSRKSWNKLFHVRGKPIVYAAGGRKVLALDDRGLKWCDIEKERVEDDRVIVTYKTRECINVTNPYTRAAFTYCESLVF